MRWVRKAAGWAIGLALLAGLLVWAVVANVLTVVLGLVGMALLMAACGCAWAADRAVDAWDALKRWAESP